MAIFAVMLISCENNLKVIEELAREDTLAAITAKGITFYRSDSGNVLLRLNASAMNRYEGDDPSIEFPEGFDAVFFDESMNETAHIRANYGISHEKTKFLEARHDVEVENYETKEKLNTETLYWDQNKKIIYTRNAVKITSPDKVIFGDSLTATENFDKRTIHNVRATLEVDEEELE